MFNISANGKVSIVDIPGNVIVERWPVDAQSMIQSGTGRIPTDAELKAGKVEEPAAPAVDPNATAPTV